MRAIDLFAGAGGFTEGARLAGVPVVWAANHWRLAVSVHARNHPEVTSACQDLQQADWRQVPEMDLVLASPACQGHSSAGTRGGKGIRGSVPGHDALRSTAWAVVSCLEVHRPPVALIENVQEFARWVLYPSWRQALSLLGYALAEHRFNAADAGVPQERTRLFITAMRGKVPLELRAPSEPWRGIGAFLDADARGWEPVADKTPGVQVRIAKGRRNIPRGSFITQHVTGHPGRDLGRPLGTVTTKHQWALVREGADGDEVRMLNRAEYRRAMGFPEEYWLPESVCDSVKLLGNAVSPPLAAGLIDQIKRRV